MSSASSTSTPPNGFRTFLIVWATQALAVFGFMVAFFSLTVWLTQVLYPAPDQRAQLSAALSAASLAWVVPGLVFAPLAGSWVDRHDRRITMMGAGVLQAVTTLALLSLMVSGRLNLSLLVGLLGLLAASNAFHAAAFDTSYVMLVPRSLLPRANGMMQTVWSLATVLAPGTAAIILAVPSLAKQGAIGGALGDALARLQNGAPLSLALQATTFVIAAVALIFLRIPSPEAADTPGGARHKKGLWSDVVFGADYIWQRRPLLWLLLLFAVINLVGSTVGIFQPLMLKYNAAADWGKRGFTFETALAMLGTAAGAGGVAGGLIVSTWGGLKSRRVWGVLVPLVVLMGAYVVYSLSPFVYLMAAAMSIAAFTGPVANAHSQAIWQAQTPPELQGRVFAVRRVVAQFTAPIGMMLAGWAGGRFNPASVLLVLALAGGAVVASQLANRSLLRIDEGPLQAAAPGKAAVREVPHTPDAES
ncbi:MAG: MFS transporter [Bacillota bacterium]|nr:MFS transporter [Bacillota bacterium]